MRLNDIFREKRKSYKKARWRKLIERFYRRQMIAEWQDEILGAGYV